MLKSIIAVTFLLSFAMQTFSTAFIVLDYFTNRAAFAKSCENKATPQMHCNGQCQMRKQLNQEQQKDQQNPERKGENKNEVVLFASLFSNDVTYTAQTPVHLIYPNLCAGKEIKMPRTIFHPPGA